MGTGDAARPHSGPSKDPLVFVARMMLLFDHPRPTSQSP